MNASPPVSPSATKRSDLALGLLAFIILGAAAVLMEAPKNFSPINRPFRCSWGTGCSLAGTC